jgi:hypothetical protein
MGVVRGDGYAIVRGLPPSVESFTKFTDAFQCTFLPHQGGEWGYRKYVGEDRTVVTVTLGTNAISWHRERGYAPMSPDLLFFFCISAPPSMEGGETLLCDGAALYESLSPKLKDHCAQVTIRYPTKIARDDTAGLRALFAAIGVDSIDDAIPILKGLSADCYHGDAFSCDVDAEAIQLNYVVPLLMRSSSGTISLCGYFVGDVQCFLSDGQALPSEILPTADAVAYAHRWEDGDLLVIDNWRVMHARGVVTDSNRNVVLRMGKFAPLDRVD